MSLKFKLVIGFIAIFSVGLLIQDSEAQFFRTGNRYCPQPVLYVPPPCATVQYYVPVQPQFYARPFLPPPTMQPGIPCATQPVVPMITAPASPAASATAVAPSPTGIPVLSQPAAPIATQTSNPIAPVPVETPLQNVLATLEPVPTGDTQIAPGPPIPPTAEPPILEPAPTGAKSILDKGN